MEPGSGPVAPLHNSSVTESSSVCKGRSCPWWPYSSSHDFTSNAALILTILFSALVVALALNATIRYFIRTRTAVPEVEDDIEAAEQKEVHKLIFSPGMKLGGSEATECAICLSEFVEGDALRVLEKCNHGFHIQCVHKWLAAHSSCPTCRANCSTHSVLPTTNHAPSLAS